MDTRLLLARLYGIRPRRGRAGLVRRLWRGLVAWVREHDRRLALVTLGLTALGAFSVYYYNRLTVLEYDVRKAEANLTASELRRGHIQHNLTRLLRHYADYESRVMEEITRVRTGSELDRGAEPAPPGSNQDLLGRLQVIAEQYPGLRLTDSTQQLGSAVVAAETDITQRIVEYNEAVNVYTTVLNQFPGNVAGPAMGFEEYDFYAPEEGSPTEYRELEL